MLLLSSYQRMLRYLTADNETALSDAYRRKMDVMNWISVVSRKVEEYLGRELEIKTRTEYFDVTRGQRSFSPVATPVLQVSAVAEDGSGLFEGGESELTDFFISSDSKDIVLQNEFDYDADNVLEITYLGGMAYHGTRSTFAISSSTGTFTTGNFVVGGTSGAMGIVRSYSSSQLVVENLYGIFEAAETLSEYASDDEDQTTALDTCTLSSITKQSLAEAYPDIVRAAEIQVRHYWKHKNDFGVQTSSRDGTVTMNLVQPTIYTRTRSFIPEAQMLLAPYRQCVGI